ncbi:MULTISPECIES: tyrosine-type recombinase/integrase [Metallosphaera]|uniref:Phage integrase family protein n=3 Tax=Metallosphaera TaxID=41980 RepID=A4YD18_METS5|nr:MULTISPECIES: tyrosine-type recombinase/integrase [Metallosphaera]ABP94320.1 phage integrase family protein [Metallosphaera sedula DSM 5348]AIM26307.1 phage integrase family protein [Metallosphaera sedula]AKV73320.1 integrase [Metallosphaera sedula]AKV75564.1 integrase [Metallosphaera sedula]AKV77810.1 integrase [Metallosphaera sedula]
MDVEKLTDEQRQKLLKRAVEKLGTSRVCEMIGKSRRTVYVYLRGHDERGIRTHIPDEVVGKVMSMLPIDEVYEVLEGFNTKNYTPNDIIGILSKAARDPEFRNLFLALASKILGDYLRGTSFKYVVTKDDVEHYEKLISQTRSKVTSKEHIAYLRRALADLGYELTPEKLKEYMLELQSENVNVARHTSYPLKVFIKEIIRPRDPQLAFLLYTSFKTPKGKTRYKPPALSLELLKKVYSEIEEPGAKAYFRILAETGLRTGELFGLTLEQVDLDRRIIYLMKDNQTKRAYISFIHEKTAQWIRNWYLTYREDFVNKYIMSLKKLKEANKELQDIDEEKWKSKFFPFSEDMIRESIRQAMGRVGVEFRLYDVRSFFASHLAKQGVSPLIINILQGRAPPQQFKILQEHYFVISMEELQKVYEEKAPTLQ